MTNSTPVLLRDSVSLFMSRFGYNQMITVYVVVVLGKLDDEDH